MRTFIRLEARDGKLFNRLANASHKLEELVNKLTTTGKFGGDTIKDEFQTVIRVFPETDFQNCSEHYKPVAKKGRKHRAALITHNLEMERLEEKSDAYIFNRFADCLISSVRKLPDLKVRDVEIEALIDAIERLKMNAQQA